MRRELLIGCGNNRDKKLHLPERPEWEGLVTLDSDLWCGPDIHLDLRQLEPPDEMLRTLGYRLPFDDNAFAEIHAYEVLEHCGTQGDHALLFDQFSEFWRILEPGGYLFATVPHFRSLWAFGDPSHSRIINRGTLVFLDQMAYAQVGKSPMSDYRSIYQGDFELANDGTIGTDPDELTYYFVLRAVKPARRAP